MMKRFLTLTLVLIMLCSSVFAVGYLPQEADIPTVPDTMKPGTVVVYDEDLEPHFIQGGYPEAEDIAVAAQSVESNPYPYIVPIPEDASESEARQIRDENEAALELYRRFLNVDIAPASGYEVCAGMRVEYGSDGAIDHIYYPNDNAPSGYSPYNPDAVARVYNKNIKIVDSHTATWGDHNNKLIYQPTSDSFLGTGRATYYWVETNQIGNRNNPLKAYDCSTQADLDYSKVGDKDISIRNLDTDKVFTYHQADVGGLPDAIIDIWGATNLRELAGTAAGQPTSNADNVRYFHYRFSDQAVPYWRQSDFK